VNDKGRYRQQPAVASRSNPSRGVRCNRNPETIIHRILKLLFAADVPFRCLHRSVAKQKLDLFQFASRSVTQAGATAAKVVWGQIVYSGLLGAPLYRVPDDVCGHTRRL
jgi:hypothetical protein